MSTHAIAWFNDEDVLGLSESSEVAAAPPCERRWERIKIDCRLRVAFTVGSEVETIDGQGNDVSGGGMSVYIPAELAVGDNVTVELVRRYGKPRVTAAATVNNRNGFRYGLEFVGLEDDQREQVVKNFTQDLQ
jgi:hypothetical protein